MTTLTRNMFLFALLAGTSLVPVAASAQDQPGNGASQELIKPREQSSQSIEGAQDQTNTSRSDQIQQQDQAASPDSSAADQDLSATDSQSREDQNAASDDQTDKQLKKHRNTAERQDQGAQEQNRAASDEMEPNRKLKKNHTAADSERRTNDDAAQGKVQSDRDSASDTRSDKRLRNNNDTAEGRKSKNNDQNDQASTNRTSNEITGSISISTKEKTVIRDTIIRARVKPVHMDIKVTVGVKVPRKVRLHPLPPEVVKIVPAYREYEYFILADGRIVIVQPDTYEIVYIIV